MKKVTFLLAAMLFVSQAVFSQNKTTENSKQNMQNDKDSLSYSFGLLIAKNLKGQGLDSLNYDQVIEGMKGAFNGDSKMTPQQADAFIKQYMQKAANEKAMKNLEEGKKFLAENGKRKGVTTTASGLQYEVVVQGSGPKPENVNTNVTAHYHGTLIDGTVFDSSVERNQPFVTNVGQVIKAWQEALLMMNVGTKLRIYCPSDLAYGERGAGGAIGPNSVLIFEMELISINK